MWKQLVELANKVFALVRKTQQHVGLSTVAQPVREALAEHRAGKTLSLDPDTL